MYIKQQFDSGHSDIEGQNTLDYDQWNLAQGFWVVSHFISVMPSLSDFSFFWNFYFSFIFTFLNSC